jgi:hypothetical protein
LVRARIFGDELTRYLDLVGEGKAPESVLERIAALEQRVKAKQTELGEYVSPNVVDFNSAQLHRQLRENLGAFRLPLTSRHVPKARQVLRKLLGDEVLWFEALEGGGYRLTGDTPARSALRRLWRGVWCPGEDLNLHGISTTGT